MLASRHSFLCGLILLGSAVTLSAAEPLKLLIIDGQNNHDWKATTPVLKSALEKTGRFTVDVATTPPGGQAKEAWGKFRPKFADYQAVLSNYNGELWPAPVQKDLENYVAGGGGLVIVHAANNAFPEWAEFNKMIGLGWRDSKFGERLYLDDEGKEVRVPKGEGKGTGETNHPYAVVVRDANHPITKGVPKEWMHAKDQLMHNLRGPAEGMKVLATTYCPATKANEPIVWTVEYGKGRIVHTPMGHDVFAMSCVGFVTTMQRSTEWAATGKVSIAIPENFPSTDKPSQLPAEKK